MYTVDFTIDVNQHLLSNILPRRDINTATLMDSKMATFVFCN